MQADLDIDLSNLHHGFSTDPVVRQGCAHCGRVIEEDEVPLLLFRNEGHEALAMHWECAEKRIRPAREQYGAE
jgi:hypothetical protein